LLVSRSWIPHPPWEGPAELGRVTRTDPPLDQPGMSEVVLDAAGRLARFVSVPPREASAPAPAGEPDWSAAIAEAGFDVAMLGRATPVWTSPVDSDRKAAWDGLNPDQAAQRVHFEAASYRGRPVYFEVFGPWAQASEPASGRSPIFPLALLLLGGSVFGACAVGLAVLLTRRNVRLGRGDARGALRVVAFAFVAIILADLAGARHTASALDEYGLLIEILSQGTCGSLIVWLTYMALEPAVRRRWPHTLISWSRLLAARWRDPLVGRDVLVGMVAAIAILIEYQLARVATAALGRPPRIRFAGSVLDSPFDAVSLVLLIPVLAVAFSLSALFFLYLFQAIVRRPWAARALLFLSLFLPGVASTQDLPISAISAAFFAGLWAALLVRFGLLAAAAFVFTVLVFQNMPLTLDLSAWYAGRSFAVLALLAALLTFAGYTALGGKRLFGRPVLED